MEMLKIIYQLNKKERSLWKCPFPLCLIIFKKPWDTNSKKPLLLEACFKKIPRASKTMSSDLYWKAHPPASHPIHLATDLQTSPRCLSKTSCTCAHTKLCVLYQKLAWEGNFCGSYLQVFYLNRYYKWILIVLSDVKHPPRNNPNRPVETQ